MRSLRLCGLQQMFNKLLRYYHTLRHLKFIQVRYQLYYRFRRKFLPFQYRETKGPVNFRRLNLQPFPDQYEHYLGNNNFTFLNLEYHFNKEIDWNYTGHGKLWAYHLNYFDYLHQPGMIWETGYALIQDFLKSPADRSEGMEPYPISLRCINWIKFMIRHNTYPDDMVRSLKSQYTLLEQQLEFHLLGNHLLENIFSLLYGAIFLEDRKLLRKATRLLQQELDEQILEDGAHFELSPMYHCIIMQRMLDCYNLLLTNDIASAGLKEIFKENLNSMYRWLNNMTFRNGDIPHFNDSVEGQYIRSAVIQEYADRLGIIADGKTLSDSGYRKFTSGDMECVVDAGKPGPDYIPGHAHADMLSFVLYIKGEPVIVDTGISTYENSPDRHLERSTISHNTVTINNKNQSDVWGGFRLGKRAGCAIISDNEHSLKAFHDGYNSYGVKTYRSVRIDQGSIELTDVIEGSEQVRGVTHFHFAPGMKVSSDKNNVYAGGVKVSFGRTGNIIQGPYSYCLGFNKKAKATRVSVEFSKKLTTIISE